MSSGCPVCLGKLRQLSYNNETIEKRGNSVTGGPVTKVVDIVQMTEMFVCGMARSKQLAAGRWSVWAYDQKLTCNNAQDVALQLRQEASDAKAGE